MSSVAHDFLFTFDQPEKTREALLKLLNLNLQQPRANTPRQLMVRNALTILIIDTDEQRAYFLNNLLAPVGYRSYVVASPLEAFKIFVQGEMLPHAIIIGNESARHFFIQRLLQQMVQKYEWEPLLIRLKTHESLSRSQTQENELGFPTQVHGQTSKEMTPIPPFLNDAQSSEPIQQLIFSQQHHTTGQNPILSPSDADTTGQQLPIQPKAPLKGQNIGRYRINDIIGNGPFCSVYRAFDFVREQEVVMKCVKVDLAPFYLTKVGEQEISLFQQESDLLQRLKHHPHILPILACGKFTIGEDSYVYKILPLCADLSLAHWLYLRNKVGKISIHEAVSVTIQLAEALQHAHNHHLIYQNFKMSNVLLLKREADMHNLKVALSDFSTQQNRIATISSPDSFAYTAPERWEGQALVASDQYGLAAICYELLTGEPLFQGRDERTLKSQHTTQQPTPPSEINNKIPKAMDDVLLRALKKVPTERYPSIIAFASALSLCQK